MFIEANTPALVLAPMEGVTDASMRDVMGATGAFSFGVSEFIRVSHERLPAKVFLRHVPELRTGSQTDSGMPVQVQLLGGDPGLMADSAATVCGLGAKAIDINFGCPAPTVNRHDGGATLLKFPKRIREIVAAVRAAVPRDVPVSAKLRLGWDTLDSLDENTEMAAEGGAAWLTLHGRTRLQGYAPPAQWEPIGRVRERLAIPVIANGDIWSVDDFRRCRETTGCCHFMLGRGALANPWLASRIAAEFGQGGAVRAQDAGDSSVRADWVPWLRAFERRSAQILQRDDFQNLKRLKQWLRIAHLHGEVRWFDSVKRVTTTSELYAALLPAIS